MHPEFLNPVSARGTRAEGRDRGSQHMCPREQGRPPSKGPPRRAPTGHSPDSWSVKIRGNHMTQRREFDGKRQFPGREGGMGPGGLLADRATQGRQAVLGMRQVPILHPHTHLPPTAGAVRQTQIGGPTRLSRRCTHVDLFPQSPPHACTPVQTGSPHGSWVFLS